MTRIAKLVIMGLTAAFVSVLSTAAFAGASDPTIRVCTGGVNGNYFAAGTMLKDAATTLNVRVVETKGTLDNLERMLELDVTDERACDAMIGQPDGAVYFTRKSPAHKAALKSIIGLHHEYLHVLCNADSGVDDLGDLENSPKKNGYSLDIGEYGSGAWLVWQNIITEDEDYAEVPTKNEGGILATTSVASNDTTCMLVPAGLGNGTVTEVDSFYSEQIILAEANDRDFNDAKDIDGKPLYTYTKIPKRTYPNLQKGWGGKPKDTIGWRAVLYINKDRMDDKTLRRFIQSAGRAANQIKAAF